MEAVLRMVERKYGQARRIWVMDRGIVSEENLAAIRRRGGQYLVGTPRSQMKKFEAELLKDDWTQVRPEVEVKQVPIPGGGNLGGEETYVLCRTAGRKEKRRPSATASPSAWKARSLAWPRRSPAAGSRIVTKWSAAWAASKPDIHKSTTYTKSHCARPKTACG
jgi:hypothetical protein